MSAIDELKNKGYMTEEEYSSYLDLYHSVFNRMFIADIVDCWQKALIALSAKKREKILDVGDSGLRTAEQIFKMYPDLDKLAVIDIITDRYNSAVKTYAQSISNRIEFNVMDARAMTFKDETFDKVIATNNINEITRNWKKAVSEMIRVLKVNGDLILTEHRLNPKLNEDKLFSDAFISLTKMGHANDILLKDIVKISSKLKLVKKHKNNRGWFIHFKKIHN